MLAGHEALKVRKAVGVEPSLSSPESAQPSSNDFALASDTLSVQSELIARTVASAVETSAPDEASTLTETPASIRTDHRDDSHLDVVRGAQRCAFEATPRAGDADGMGVS